MRDFFSAEFFVCSVTSLIGTLGFAIVFRVRAFHVSFVGICGLLTYVIFYTVEFFGSSLFVASFVSAGFCALFSEIFARYKKAPAVIFLLPGSIPIVPGGDLYHTMKYLLAGDFETAFAYMLSAIKTGVGIAGGIVAVSVVCKLIFDKERKKREIV